MGSEPLVWTALSTLPSLTLRPGSCPVITFNRNHDRFYLFVYLACPFLSTHYAPACGLGLSQIHILTISGKCFTHFYSVP